MTFAEQLSARIRLAILQALQASADFGLHEYVLLERIQSLGLGTTRDALRTETTWLANLALLNSERVEGALILRITGDGDDVVKGLNTVPGIARPRPGG